MCRVEGCLEVWGLGFRALGSRVSGFRVFSVGGSLNP